jgi:hypothetical protein
MNRQNGWETRRRIWRENCKLRKSASIKSSILRQATLAPRSRLQKRICIKLSMLCRLKLRLIETSVKDSTILSLSAELQRNSWGRKPTNIRIWKITTKGRTVRLEILKISYRISETRFKWNPSKLITNERDWIEWLKTKAWVWEKARNVRLI